MRCFDGVVEQTDAVVERAQEGIFLFFDYTHDELALHFDFGVGVAHRVDERVDKAVHEGLLLTQERVGVAHGAAQDAAYHISGLGVIGELRVGD